MEDLVLYGNILKSRITKVSTGLDIFPFHEVIGWIMSKEYAIEMIMYDVEDKGFASFTLAFIAKSYNMPPLEVIMTIDWVKNTDSRLHGYDKYDGGRRKEFMA